MPIPSFKLSTVRSPFKLKDVKHFCKEEQIIQEIVIDGAVTQIRSGTN